MTRGEIIGELLRRANRSAPDLLVADIAAGLTDAGGHHLVLYLVDYEQESLRPLALASELSSEPPKDIAIAGTMAGRAYQRQEVLSVETDAGSMVWSPIRERAERLGVLELGFRHMESDTLTLCEDLGRLAGHLVRTAAQYTDMIEQCRRRRRMNLAAEIQWDMLLPPLAFCAPQVAVAGILEPAYHVGGDAFDYCLNGDMLSFAMLDAMGHGLSSALASALCLAGLRYGRLRGMDLPEMARQVDDAMISQFDGDMFVTGHLVSLDTATGDLEWINSGHPDPLLVRGCAVVAEPHVASCLPLGLGITEPELGRLRLEPGDRLLFYSDGVIEARPNGGEQFGIERLRAHVERHLTDRLIPSEIIRRIVKEILEHRGDALEDDATMVMIEWLPDAAG